MFSIHLQFLFACAPNVRRTRLPCPPTFSTSDGSQDGALCDMTWLTGRAATPQCQVGMARLRLLVVCVARFYVPFGGDYYCLRPKNAIVAARKYGQELASSKI